MLHLSLTRQPWRSRAIQVLIALLLWTSPIVFAPAALREEQAGLWVRAGLSGTVVKKLLLPGGAASSRYALVAREGVYRSRVEPGTTLSGSEAQWGKLVWLPVDRDLPSRRWGNVEVQVLVADHSDPPVIYAGMGGAGSRDPARSAGLYATNDGGETWQNPVESIAGQEVQALAAMPHFRGLDPGAGSGANIAGDVTQRLTPAAVVCAATVGGIYCNTGAGRSWVGLNWRGTERVLSLAIRPNDPRAVYIGTGGFGLVITRDGGATWKQSSAQLQNRQIYDIAVSVSRPDVMYVATDDGLFASADAGSTWAQLGGPTKGRRVNTIALSTLAVVYGETVAVAPVETNALSALAEDAGPTASAGQGSGAERGWSADQPSATEIVLYAGLQYGAAYYSVDGGSSWSALNKGLGTMTVLSLTLDPQDPSILWAGTTDGVWRCVLPVVRGEVKTFSSPTVTLVVTRVAPTPQESRAPAPTVTFTAENGGLSTGTQTALPSATPTTTPTAPTLPPLTATSTLWTTATRTVQATPTRTRMPSPTLTWTATPTPPPALPHATETRVPR